MGSSRSNVEPPQLFLAGQKFVKLLKIKYCCMRVREVIVDGLNEARMETTDADGNKEVGQG